MSHPTSFKPGSLVLYKSRPAIVSAATEKIDIDLGGGQQKRVRPKDIALLHPGPASLSELDAPAVAADEAWELLQGEQAAFPEFAELLCGEYSPAAAWCAWQALQDDLLFDGDLAAVSSRPPEQVEEIRSQRAEAMRQQAAWEAFVERVDQRAVSAADAGFIADVERVAYDRTAHSRVLAHFGVEATPRHAHAFLLRCGYWREEHNPYPHRVRATLDPVADMHVEMPADERLDLTALPAYAIDDADNQDPDDAVSCDGDRVWVHVADVAALVVPDDPLDQAARARGATLYLPEKTVTMLPDRLTDLLGMGLAAESPALSVGFRLGSDGVEDPQCVLSRVRVERLSYEVAEDRINTGDLGRLREIADAHRAQRRSRGAIDLDLPEVAVRWVDGEVRIRPLPRTASRALVSELMLMAGDAVGRLLADRGLAAPYAVQAAPAETRVPESLAEAYAFRRSLRPSQASLAPGLHAALGLEHYVRVTSPLRRYLDLVTHQQLRAMLGGRDALSSEQIADRIRSTEPETARIRQAERQSNLHWKLVWLKRQPRWEGQGTVAALDERKATVVIPELALDARVRRRASMAPDDVVRLRVSEIDLADQLAYFRVLD